ncbi:MAG: SDR family oxidoreductase [Burkholderiales bacterium]|nr:SDR family oxidoreductase [Burkholderiales bacterium]
MTATQGTALITGASAGIGAIYADRFAKRGFDLILVARDEARLRTLAAKLQQESGVRVDVLRADLALPADLARVEARLSADEHVSVLVNNAGIVVNGAMVGADADAVERMIRLNVIAVTRLAGAVLPRFAARNAGTLINVASVVPLIPESFGGTYSATKAYVLNYSQSLQHELRDTAVRVQAVLPGATRTEIWERSGIDVSNFPAEMLMDAGEMVDAALAGLDQGELVTIPSLPQVKDWAAFEAARLALAPNLSRDHAASRYKVVAANAA